MGWTYVVSLGQIWWVGPKVNEFDLGSEFGPNRLGRT